MHWTGSDAKAIHRNDQEGYRESLLLPETVHDHSRGSSQRGWNGSLQRMHSYGRGMRRGRDVRGRKARTRQDCRKPDCGTFRSRFGEADSEIRSRARWGRLFYRQIRKTIAHASVKMVGTGISSQSVISPRHGFWWKWHNSARLSGNPGSALRSNRARFAFAVTDSTTHGPIAPFP